MLAVKELISVRKIREERPKVAPKWCAQQTADIEHIFVMVEDLIAIAVSCNQSPHNYTILESTKQQFINEFLNISDKYRLLCDECSDRCDK